MDDFGKKSQRGPWSSLGDTFGNVSTIKLKLVQSFSQ